MSAHRKQERPGRSTVCNSATDSLAPNLKSHCLVVGKSTVPAGTARSILGRIRAAAPAGNQVDLAWNPEFLREGHAVQDTLRPDRLVFGVASEWAEATLRQIYAEPLAAGVPGLTMDLETAELVKVSANAFLATKISFINAIADACQAVGADVLRLADALGYDKRIGRRSFPRASVSAEDACLKISARSMPPRPGSAWTL